MEKEIKQQKDRNRPFRSFIIFLFYFLFYFPFIFSVLLWLLYFLLARHGAGGVHREC